MEDGEYETHMVQICRQDLESTSANRAPAILMLHGAIENHRIFVSDNKAQGVAPFLAHRGYNVFLGNLRGRGMGRPSLKHHSDHGQTEAIRETIPALSAAVKELSGRGTQSWVSHSWVGVLMASAMAYDHTMAATVNCQAHFGTKETSYHTQHYHRST